MNTSTRQEYELRITFGKQPKQSNTEPFKAEAAYAIELDKHYDKFLFLVHGQDESTAIRKKDVLSLIGALKEAVTQGWTV